MSEDYVSLNIFTLAEVFLAIPTPIKYSFEDTDASIKDSFLVWTFMLFINILET